MRISVTGWTKATLIVLLATASTALSGTEMSKADKHWLEQEVAPLITEEERALFNDLETEEERSIFKRIFWARRDPTPSTPANELMDEYETLLEIANRNFRVMGRRGAATDRGKVFLLLGVPVQSEPDSLTETDRSYDEVGAAGERSTARTVPGAGTLLPMEGRGEEVPGAALPSGSLTAQSESAVQVWTYSPNEGRGIPDGLTVRFRDQAGSGYRLIHDEAVVQSFERAKKSYLVNRSVNYVRDAEGRLLEPETKVESEKPPIPAPSPILLDLRDTRVVSSDISFRAEISFFRSNEGSIYVPILFDIDAATLSWDGDRASATVVGLVENDWGDLVQQFEETAVLVKRPSNRAVFEMPLQLDPGQYTLFLGIRDDSASSLGTRILDLNVPTFTADDLKLSSILLFTEGKKVDDSIGRPGEAFILGGFRFIPKLDRIYERVDRLSGVFVAYSFGVVNAKPDLTAQYIFLQNGVRRGQTSEEPFISPGEEMAITVFDMPLSSFEPGEYTLRIKVTDDVRDEVVTRDIDFVLK